MSDGKVEAGDGPRLCVAAAAKDDRGDLRVIQVDRQGHVTLSEKDIERIVQAVKAARRGRE